MDIGSVHFHMCCVSIFETWDALFQRELTQNVILCRLAGWLSDKESACQYRRRRRFKFDLWVKKIPWRRKWQPTPYSCLKNPMDRGAWQATVHGVAKSQTWLKRLSIHVWGCSSASSSPLLTTSLLYYLPKKLFFTVNILLLIMKCLQVYVH